MEQTKKLGRRDFLRWCGLAAAATALAACAPAAPAAAPTAVPAQATEAPAGQQAAPATTGKGSLRYMYWGTEQEAAVKAQVEAFKQVAPGITVDAQLVPWDQYWDKLLTAIAGGSAPETYWLNMDNFTALVAKDALFCIQPYLDKEDAAKADWTINFDPLKEAYSYNKEAYSWPRDYDTIAVAVNLDLFKAAGLDYPSSADNFKAWDWGTFRTYAEKLTKQEGGRTTQFGVLATNTDQEGWFNWIYSNGGTILNQDKTQVTIGEKPALDALREYVSYRLKGWSPGEESLQSQDTNAMFYTGKLGMMITGDWNVGVFNDNIKDFEWDLLPIPYAPTGKSICMIHGLGNTIDKKAKDPELCFQWIKFLGSKDGSSILGKTGTVIPSRQDTAQLWFDPSFKPAHRKIYLDWTPTAVFFPNTAKPSTAEWEKPILDQLTLVMEQGKDLEQAINEAVQTANNILAGKAT